MLVRFIEAIPAALDQSMTRVNAKYITPLGKLGPTETNFQRVADVVLLVLLIVVLG